MAKMTKNGLGENGETSLETALQAIYGSADHPLKIGDIEIPCYVLEDNTRVLVRSSMLTALDMKAGSASAGLQGDRLTKFIGTKSLRDYVPSKLEAAINNPIRFRTPKGQEAYGYEATVLADLCETVLEAKEKGKFNHQQDHIAKRCQILIRGFARVGIIALVDEVTGYQAARSRQALEEILAKFISDELLAWAKTFPDEFYEQIFRLKGLRYSQISSKRPRYVGSLTNDIVYQRLAPGVLEELKRITPKDEKGRRKHKYFQRLSESDGQQKLREHLSNVITLMRASPNFPVFYRLLNRALPRYKGNSIQGTLDLEVDSNYDQATEND
jgi:hypothetical protein